MLKFPFYLSLISLTPMCSCVVSHTLGSSCFAVLWVLGARDCDWRAGEPQLSSLSSIGSLALLHPSFLLFLRLFIFYFASVSRQCCAACHSVQRPWCRASPPPESPLDAGWKRPPQILHGWPSGNSGSCSLLILKWQERHTDFIMTSCFVAIYTKEGQCFCISNTWARHDHQTG